MPGATIIWHEVSIVAMDIWPRAYLALADSPIRSAPVAQGWDALWSGWSRLQERVSGYLLAKLGTIDEL